MAPANLLAKSPKLRVPEVRHPNGTARPAKVLQIVVVLVMVRVVSVRLSRGWRGVSRRVLLHPGHGTEVVVEVVEVVVAVAVLKVPMGAIGLPVERRELSKWQLCILM